MGSTALQQPTSLGFNGSRFKIERRRRLQHFYVVDGRDCFGVVKGGSTDSQADEIYTLCCS